MGLSVIAAIISSSPSKTSAGPSEQVLEHHLFVTMHKILRNKTTRIQANCSIIQEIIINRAQNRTEPEKNRPSFPVIFATEPPGARFPYKTCRCPVFFMGFDNGLIIGWNKKKAVNNRKSCIIILY